MAKKYISAHILRKEAECKCGKCGRANFVPSYRRTFESMVAMICKHYGRKRTVYNTNLRPGRNGGNRCDRQNRVAKGARGSKHKVWIKENGERGGIAGDWACDGMSQGELAYWGRKAGFKGIGIYRGNVHLDTRKTKRVVKWGPGSFRKPKPVTRGVGP
jgi:hypothetical protein